MVVVEKTLHEQIETSLNSILTQPVDIPAYIQENLKHEFRPYQLRALEHFIFTQENANAALFRHLLFRMATGSGKTNILASVILYLFKEKGMQNFIFFVDSDAIIKKTELNLTEAQESKYLFNPNGIWIDNEAIQIKVVNTFPLFQEKNVIYIKFTTIQKLHKDLNDTVENQVTFDSLQDTPLVLLADEAHHINASTKSSKKADEHNLTWEGTVLKILNLNPANVLFEFTATIDLENKNLRTKYGNKLVFDYSLTQFMIDKYSKNVKLIRNNSSDEEKMIQSALLSQYRKYIAAKYNKYLKPIILFQSTRIEISYNSYNKFIRLIDELTSEKLKDIIERGLQQYEPNTTLYKAYNYYFTSGNYVEMVRDLKADFNSSTALNVNDKNFLNIDNSRLLNTLEDITNPIRTIFAVAKLNEGWDVLNLFDIVRINEGAASGKSATDSEAQLIGRGARYYPIKFDDLSHLDILELNKRKFDYSADERAILEVMHFHTINENAYIKKLESSLNANQIIITNDYEEILEAKVKNKFKDTDVFKKGKIYINKVYSPNKNDYKCLQDYGVQDEYEIEYSSVVEQLVGENAEKTANKVESINYNKNILQKAIRLHPFFTFNNLKKYVPNLLSVNEFMTSKAYLGALTIKIKVPKQLDVSLLSPSEKVGILVRVLDSIAASIKNAFGKNKGTKEFVGIPLKDLIDDYSIVISNSTNAKNMNLIVKNRPKPMNMHDWYVFDKAIVNGLEENLIDFIADNVELLKEKYSNIYLIRNERFKGFKLVEFNGVRGFMPDFVLLLQKDNFYYQVFIEPKGKHLVDTDRWKETLLLSITNDEAIHIEDDNVRLIGLRFYSDQKESEMYFKEDFEQYVIKKS